MDEVYVFIWLPGQKKPEVCGLLEYFEDGRNSRSRFTYGRKYLKRKDAIALDPMQLPLTEDTFDSPPGFDLHGVFRDSAPDGWGRHVLSRMSSTLELSEIEYLVLADNFDRFGALGFGSTPNAPGGFNKYFDSERQSYGSIKISQTDDFGEIINAINSITKNKNLMFDELVGESPHLPKASNNNLQKIARYLIRGSSLGGARPKATVMIEDELWLAKFERQDDRFPVVQSEFACMLIAKEFDLNVPPIRLCRLGDRYIYLIKRFDRQSFPRDLSSTPEFTRVMAYSGLSALGAHEMDSGIYGYLDLNDFLRTRGSEYEKDKQELFKRIALNIAVSNTDDHLRNHCFLDSDGLFKLSPLYDVCPVTYDTSSVKRLYLKIGSHGREATFENLKSYGNQAGISDHFVKESLERLREILEIKLENNFEAAEMSKDEIKAFKTQIRVPST